jgi:hypothetical protein
MTATKSANERHVAVHHDDARRLRIHRPKADGRRVARSALLLLDRRVDTHPRKSALQICLDVLSPVAHDDDDLAAPRVEGRLHDEVHHRQTCHGVHHLRESALHALSLSCRKYYGRRCAHTASPSSRRLSPCDVAGKRPAAC